MHFKIEFFEQWCHLLFFLLITVVRLLIVINLFCYAVHNMSNIYTLKSFCELLVRPLLGDILCTVFVWAQSSNRIIVTL